MTRADGPVTVLRTPTPEVGCKISIHRADEPLSGAPLPAHAEIDCTPAEIAELLVRGAQFRGRGTRRRRPPRSCAGCCRR